MSKGKIKYKEQSSNRYAYKQDKHTDFVHSLPAFKKVYKRKTEHINPDQPTEEEMFDLTFKPGNDVKFAKPKKKKGENRLKVKRCFPSCKTYRNANNRDLDY